ncbi:tetratricopeptide repeat protein [Petrocella sp. FN5]|uniref:tetratricopeptide repeat protein n=1 Tax=Petrocella sp. FN5 TaxID=3032002 RepID=UPI0023DA3F6B|nr:tetratricopeptide repeat protein [Petrocella sp. FN5]MDF1615945.1 tetratricopeptide repeat protein [Petrocella sp. FN5]
MAKLKSKWRSITIGYLLVSYFVIVVINQQPITYFLIGFGVYFLILVLLFLGTFVGVLGVLIQTFTKDNQKALPFYKSAYKLGTQNTTILATYGLLLLRNNEVEQALKCFDKGLETNSYFLTTKTLMGNKAICYWKLGHIDKAIQIYYDFFDQYGAENQGFLTDPTYTDETINAVVKDNPYYFPQDFTTLGYLFVLKEDYVKATFFTKAALNKNEDYAGAYDNLGLIAFRQDDLTQAKKYFEKALELDENAPDTLYHMGLISQLENNNTEALNYLEKAKSCYLDGLSTISYEMIDGAIKHSKTTLS